MERVQREIQEARRLYARRKWQTIDVTRRLDRGNAATILPCWRRAASSGCRRSSAIAEKEAVMRGRFLTAICVAALAVPVFAADGIEVRRGEDSMLFGTCVPSLVVENKSSETVDFLQVDLMLVLNDGQQRTVPLQSAYRDGILHPITPGARAMLKQPLDLSRSLGVGCGDVKSRSVARTICEAGGKACASLVTIQP
jgi:hypothetical protein